MIAIATAGNQQKLVDLVPHLWCALFATDLVTPLLPATQRSALIERQACLQLPPPTPHALQQPILPKEEATRRRVCAMRASVWRLQIAILLTRYSRSFPLYQRPFSFPPWLAYPAMGPPSVTHPSLFDTRASDVEPPCTSSGPLAVSLQNSC